MDGGEVTMAIRLTEEAYQKLIDEDNDWLMKQPRTLERDHIADCLLWLRENRPQEMLDLIERCKEVCSQYDWYSP